MLDDLQDASAKCKSYRPSNSTEGDWFEGRFCARCEEDRAFRNHERNPCEILGRALAFDCDHEEFPKEWVTDENGPRCTAFRPEGTGTSKQAQRDRERYEAAMAEMRAAQK